jgi:hypothetical protein
MNKTRPLLPDKLTPTLDGVKGARNPAVSQGGKDLGLEQAIDSLARQRPCVLIAGPSEFKTKRYPSGTPPVSLLGAWRIPDRLLALGLVDEKKVGSCFKGK